MDHMIAMRKKWFSFFSQSSFLLFQLQYLKHQLFFCTLLKSMTCMRAVLFRVWNAVLSWMTVSSSLLCCPTVQKGVQRSVTYGRCWWHLNRRGTLTKLQLDWKNKLWVVLRQIRSLMSQRATDRPNLSTKESIKLYRSLYSTTETCLYCWINYIIVSFSSSFQHVPFHNLGLTCDSVNVMIHFNENEWCQSMRWYDSRQQNAYHDIVKFFMPSEFRLNRDLLCLKPMDMIVELTLTMSFTQWEPEQSVAVENPFSKGGFIIIANLKTEIQIMKTKF